MTQVKALFSARQRLVPQFGVIEGGLLDGWSFAFVRVVILKDKLYLDMQCTAPKWVFPKLVRVGTADYLSLTAGVERSVSAPCYDIQQLIDAAIERARTGQQT